MPDTWGGSSTVSHGSRFWCCRYEDVVARPEHIAGTFQRFVGVTEILGQTRDLGPINATEAPPPELLPEILWRQLAERYHAANTVLATLLASKFDTWDSD